jgi:hypothetical protein
MGKINTVTLNKNNIEGFGNNKIHNKGMYKVVNLADTSASIY